MWIGAAALMVLPLTAVRGLDPGAWDPPGDFMFLAILLAGVGAAYEVAVRVPHRRAYRAAAAVAIAAGLIQIWVNLAVGIIGSEHNPANWIYAAVVAVAAIGAVAARFRATGMAAAMTAAALAQILAFFVALAAGLGFTGPITVFFAGLWLISAWLFRKAARAEVAGVYAAT
ncbi:MAG TPA: hypothetical protein VGR19_02085 [Allosphingosinicella sp.]|nr:hypothetical protein [Allosphingosinicella sp.]